MAGRFKEKKKLPEEKKAVQAITRGNAPENAEFLPMLENVNHYHSSWDSPESFGRHIASLDKKAAWSDSGWDNDAEFAGSKNMEETLELSQKGWMDGADQCDRLRDRIVAMHPQSPRTIKYGIAGSVPSVPRAVAGNIMNMKSNDLAKARKKPVITLVCNMCSNWTISATSISNRAAVVAAIIDQIEAKGYAVEILSTAVTSGGDGWRGDGEEGFKAVTTVKVKECHQPVDTARIAFALGHASFFRRMIFADWSTQPELKFKIGISLGSVTAIKPDAEDAERSVYIIPAAGDNQKVFKDEDISATEGVKYIIDSLREQGCPAFAGTSTLPVENKLPPLDDNF